MIVSSSDARTPLPKELAAIVRAESRKAGRTHIGIGESRWPP
jgi:hypothetical protein